MIDPIVLDEAYKNFTQNFSKSLPDGVISINLQVLQDLGLLNSSQLDEATADNLSQQFHVIETSDKVTLYNEQFAVWIIPQSQQEPSSTVAMIALIQNNKPHLEIVYTTSGVYNTPRYILKVLQHFLTEVIDTEAVISSIGKKK
jgi:hypothetical protein